MFEPTRRPPTTGTNLAPTTPEEWASLRAPGRNLAGVMCSWMQRIYARATSRANSRSRPRRTHQLWCCSPVDQ